MTELETAIADNKAAIEEFIAAARAGDPASWQTPRSEGAWSRAQIAEHLAIVYEFNQKILAGTAPGLPVWLRPFRPLLRRIVMTNTLSAGRFTRKGRAPGIFQPTATPGDAAQVLSRLSNAVRGFEADIRSRPRGDGTVLHPAFGRIGMADWVRLQAIHARHHRDQLTST